jgi:hypothetical protein
MRTASLLRKAFSSAGSRSAIREDRKTEAAERGIESREKPKPLQGEACNSTVCCQVADSMFNHAISLNFSLRFGSLSEEQDRECAD